MAGGHSDRAHALLSPSSAKRWVTCTPSARLEEGFPNTTSSLAEEGTLCHELCEAKLRNKVTPDLYSKRKLTYFTKKCKENPLWSDEMERTSNEYVEKIYSDALGFSQMPVILPEEKLDLTDWIPDGFGTGDCVMIGDGQLNIYDYKHGKGVPVYADHNYQMMLYALGAWKAFGWMDDIKKVKMCIIQPRLNSITEYECSIEELLAFGEEVIKPAAKKATLGEGEFVEGDHCRFCRAKALCRKNADVVDGLKNAAGLLPPLITMEEVGKYLVLGENVEGWLKELKSVALTEALNGAEIPGWKAVNGNGKRILTDVDSAYGVLVKDHEVARGLLYKQNPVSMSEAEKLVGKTVFMDALKDYITYEPGKPALVRDTDPRPAITNKTSVEEAFKVVGGNE